MKWFVLNDSDSKPEMAIKVDRIGAWRSLPDKLEVIVDGNPIRLALDEPGTQKLLEHLIREAAQ